MKIAGAESLLKDCFSLQSDIIWYKKVPRMFGPMAPWWTRTTAVARQLDQQYNALTNWATEAVVQRVN